MSAGQLIGVLTDILSPDLAVIDPPDEAGRIRNICMNRCWPGLSLEVKFRHLQFSECDDDGAVFLCEASAGDMAAGSFCHADR